MSEIQSVNVFSVDEERLKYRVILTAGNIAAPVGQHRGEINFYLPPPTNFGNNNNYNQALIKVDSFTACDDGAVIGSDACWTVSTGLVKTSGIIINADIGSSQAVQSQIVNAVQFASKGEPQVGGFRQFIPMQVVNVGTTGLGAGAAGPSPSADGYCWVGIGSGIAATDPILSANPFGQNVKFRFINPDTNRQSWLVSAGVGANTGNIGRYTISLTVTMIPNNRSEGAD